jgi:hypothetical protein
LAVEEEGGIGEFFPREAEGGAKEDLGRPAQGHEADALLEVAVAGQEFERRLDEGLRIERDEIGLVAVDALVVSGVERAGFFRFERETDIGSKPLFLVFWRNSPNAPLHRRNLRRCGFAKTQPKNPLSNHCVSWLSTQSITSTTPMIPRPQVPTEHNA